MLAKWLLCEDEIGQPRQLRFSRGLLRIAFTGLFFGSLAVLYCVGAGAKLETAWLLISAACAIAVGWWVVTGAIIGLLCYTPQLHVRDIATELTYVVLGACTGLICDLLGGCARRCMHHNRSKRGAVDAK
jgi:hypothetical protein